MRASKRLAQELSRLEVEQEMCEIAISLLKRSGEKTLNTLFDRYPTPDEAPADMAKDMHRFAKHLAARGELEQVTNSANYV